MFEDFLSRLAALKYDDVALWGKMTPQHMVEHLILAIQMSNEKLKYDCLSPIERLPTLRRFLFSDRPLQKMFINPAIGSDLMKLRYKDIDEAKEKLREEISYYNKYFIENPYSKPTHMIFGELNKEEWDIFHKKHFTHHLSQFGL